MSSLTIRLENVSFAYDNSLVLENINLEIQQGEFLGIVGPNGGGKSTLLKLILGLLKPTSGQIFFFNTTTLQKKSPKNQRIAMGYVPQFAGFSRDFPISVVEAVLLGRLGQTQWWGGYRAHDKEIALQALTEVGIFELRQRCICQLSGGQLQRVLIARALACQPDILVLDEPTANIDMRMEEDIFDLLERLNARLTIIVVSHDIGFISHYITRVACLNRTLICHQTLPLSSEVIQQLYGVPVHAVIHAHSAPNH